MKANKDTLTPFEKCSYIVQVRRLRALAKEAIKSFEIDASSIVFINHGENATFKVIARGGDKFLLRIHRKDYHSKPAIETELRWLELLARRDFQVPRPIRNNKGHQLVEVDYFGVGKRHCGLFHWIDGRFLSKSISESDMFKIGSLLAKIQQVGRTIECKSRRYWTSEGLVGANPKFGSIDRVIGLRKEEQTKLTQTRKRIFSKLKAYERSFPKKMGMIHADLHFGNLLKAKGGVIAAIDFDDSGLGFYVYDLVIPLVGAEQHLRLHKRFRAYPKLKKALIAGYREFAELTDHDLAILQDLIVARKLLMIGWLQSRSDNPKISKRVTKYARQTLKYIANL